jgi:hypothetical protein
MNMTVLLLVMLLLVACAEERSTGPCGESFCLPSDAQLLSKQTPVEDFNLYQVAWRGAQFGIYEGNQPQGRDDGSRAKISLPGGRAATLRVSDDGGSIIVDMQKAWPAYLDVMGPCQSTEECPLRSFAGKLRLRS